MQGTEKPDYGRLRRHRHARRAAGRWSLPGLARGRHADRGRASSSSPQLRPVGAEAVAALLMVGTIAGILMATFLNNGGGAWDNAKKYIETGALRRQGLATAQGRRRRRHRRRSLQGHRRPVAPRADQAARDDHAGAGAAVHLTGEARSAIAGHPEGRTARGIPVRQPRRTQRDPSLARAAVSRDDSGRSYTNRLSTSFETRNPRSVKPHAAAPRARGFPPRAKPRSRSRAGRPPASRHAGLDRDRPATPSARRRPRKISSRAASSALDRPVERERPAARLQPLEVLLEAARRSPAAGPPRARARRRRGRASASASSTSRCGAPRRPGRAQLEIS